MSKHQLTKRSVRRSLSLTAASAMVLALMPLGSAVAQEPTPEPIGNADVCPPPPDSDTGDSATLTDIAGVHAENIECVVDYGIAQGYPDNTYRPGESIKRDQMATFIAEYVETALAETLPEGENHFTDDNGNVHEDNINKVAEAGIVVGRGGDLYAPKDDVSRAAMATFIAQAIDYLDDREVNGSIPPEATQDWFDDDDNTTHEANINRLAEQGIVQGKEDGDYHPREDVTRGQMATFIIHAAEYADELGLWAPTADQPAPTNQTFTVTPGEDTTFRTGEDQTFTITGITSETVDIALALCDNVTNTDGIITFADAENQGAGNDEADFGNVDFATITTVNGVSSNFGDYVDEEPATDGEVTVTVDTTDEGCFVVVVFDDADDNDALDLDANNEPTEAFGVSGRATSANPSQIDAEPEFALNSFGDIHQVEGQLQNEAGEDVAFPDIRVRFTVFRQSTTTEGGRQLTDIENENTAAGEAEGPAATATECDDLTNPQQVETSTTDVNGIASFSYTVEDPRTAEGDRIVDCIRVEADTNADGTFDTTDFVAKEWTDEAAQASALDLEPDTDSNAVGTRHTVIATATDQFGNPISGERVKFEVYEEAAPADGEAQPAPGDPIVEGSGTTNADGTVTFTYAGPAATAEDDSRDDVIVACLSTGDCFTFTETDAVAGTGTVAREQPSDDAEKFWVENATATQTAEGEVVGFDTAADFVDVDDADDLENLRFQYDANDQFFVQCADGAAAGDATAVANPRTIEQFEDALSEGDLIDVSAETDGVRQFRLIDEDNSATYCPPPA